MKILHLDIHQATPTLAVSILILQGNMVTVLNMPVCIFNWVWGATFALKKSLSCRALYSLSFL